ncbi:hypothetical protein AJ79_10174 [Helicocarpus griseus UAMH5409]|uniref:Uncharacterized protein n=1 Tax=Helicocarpus griseus UAMH5409 TaxID=1447875 RepID=A0A2B7W6U0_9EURO|nr:hypothetical protein AJ79_10174 [Helicocarpus griseus UAMH5409]
METDYDDYMTSACERSIRSRADNPGRAKAREAAHIVAIIESKNLPLQLM